MILTKAVDRGRGGGCCRWDVWLRGDFLGGFAAGLEPTPVHRICRDDPVRIIVQVIGRA